jgi:hypothetical protein
MRTINKREDDALKDLLNLKINNNKTMATLITIRRSLYKYIADSGALLYITD